MQRQTSAWDSSLNSSNPEKLWLEFITISGLFLAALLLFTLNLGNLPLRDWDEGTVAQVAKEIWQSHGANWRWLFPTLWGESYLNKPPLVHFLIALSYSLGGVNELTARLPGAIFSAVSVPLLYCIGRELFVVRRVAVFSALIYLTMMPVVRHGRLAMLEGALLCLITLLFLCVLRSRRDLRWALGAGMAFAALCLTKGIMGLLMAAIAFLFLAWDTPRLLSSIYFWLGFFLGSIPVFFWVAAQFFYYQEDFINTAILGQGVERVYSSVEGNSGPIWYYLLELLEGLPWIFFSVYGLKLAWVNRNWSWAKLILVWSGVYFVVVSLMMTKLPWYILPLYPSLALAGGVILGEVSDFPQTRLLPRTWTRFLGLLALVASIFSVYFRFSDLSLMVICGLVSLTLGIAAVLIQQRDLQFIPLLFWGMYVSLLLFVSSPHWIWELNEAFPVKPVATLIRLKTPEHQVVYTSFDYERPSLNFYSDRRVIPVSNEELQTHWLQDDGVYFLVEAETLSALNLEAVQILGTAQQQWQLITRE
ncbi:MAG: glycosyltransferase family 39 protein [Gomphosphaeria aponina SAG 52.96 = DSM 107014]|uniref:Glycosyltransferase family 39 protein n=1 Tax=Gomphosphaeria aponina SAG 52.96 = DSM 107014 TaxID=1521640 RepID=A0A941JRG2_9CHRO|nr:glycosyltransferase family 39 protein [Gomphosphaeria aponina SAG 52.96 = DSM 107014]